MPELPLHNIKLHRDVNTIASRSSGVEVGLHTLLLAWHLVAALSDSDVEVGGSLEEGQREVLVRWQRDSAAASNVKCTVHRYEACWDPVGGVARA